MGTQKGFTIIEVMLFLAITGLIMATLLTGITVGLNRERYHDAVNSYADFLQGQYNFVTNVNNSREPTNPCSASGIVDNGTSDDGRGTSDCTIVGRVIHSSASGTTVTSAQVYAAANTALLPLDAKDNDQKVLTDARLMVQSEQDTYSIGWSSRIVGAGSAKDLPLAFSILIIRMPTTGIVHTYVLEEADKSPEEIVSLGVTNTDFVMCVDTAGMTPGGNIGIGLKANATNSAGVARLAEGDCA